MNVIQFDATVAGFGALAMREAGTAREALLRSAVAMTLSALVASDWAEETVPEAWKATMRGIMRNAGHDRGTAHKHVNGAAQRAVKFGERFASVSARRHDLTGEGLYEAFMRAVDASDIRNVSELHSLCMTGSRVSKADAKADAAEMPEAVAAKARAAADAAADLVTAMNGALSLAPARDAEAPAMERKAERVAIVAANNAATLAGMSDADLMQHVADCHAEVTKRAEARAAAAAAVAWSDMLAEADADNVQWDAAAAEAEAETAAA